MQWLNVSYSVWFNRRHNRAGPLFQGRYKSIPVSGGAWLYQLSHYVHLNPVRVKWLGLDKRGRRLEGLGLKAAASAAEASERLKTLREYRWSSYRSYAGYESAPEWLMRETILKRTGGKGEKEQTRRYRSNLERYARGGYEESWAGHFRNSLAVGSEEFIRSIKLGLSGANREFSGKRELRKLNTFPEVVCAVECVKGEEWKKFSERHGDWGRDMALTLARETTGMTLREIGQEAGGMDYAAVSEAIRRFKMTKRQKRFLENVFDKAFQMLKI